VHLFRMGIGGNVIVLGLEAQQQGLIWERTENNLPWQHVVIFRKR
jgi:hypothetical protein